MNSRIPSRTGKWPSDGQGALVGFLVIFVASLFSCGLLFWLPQLYNDWQLNRFADNLFNYPLPPQTEVISQHMEVRLMGNGNHCDFVATQAMKTKLTVVEIEAYYDEVSLPSVSKNNAGIAPEFQGEPIPVFVDFDDSELEDGWQHFTIKIFDFGYAPGLDLRCH